jgi:hypothetical protein
MKKVFFLAVFFIVIVFVIFLLSKTGLSVFSENNNYYQNLREEIYTQVNSPDFDTGRFKQFLQSFPEYKITDYPKELLRSITFSDPRGDIVVFHDVMVGIALGLARLKEKQALSAEIKEIVKNIIKRRASVWHDFPWENHYSREMAALSSLMYVIGDKRFEKYQKKLHRSLRLIYQNDGSSNEGTSYGLYNAKILAPYFYLTGDNFVLEKIKKFSQWLSRTSSLDGFFPVFDDSNIQSLKLAVSDFPLVNKNLAEEWKIRKTEENYFGPNETVFKNPEYTLWIRHKKGLSGKTWHQHFSQGDIIFKTNKNWWLVPSGYDGTRALNKPYLHNLAIEKEGKNDFWWRFWSLLGKNYQTKVKNSNASSLTLVLPDNIERTVNLKENGFSVRDYHPEKRINTYWHILGELKEKIEKEKELEFVFQQKDEALKVSIKNFDKVNVSTDYHALSNKERRIHTILHIKGSNIKTDFSLIK